MKKMMVAAALALAVTASARQEASAWSRFNFGVGLNLSYESTGACFNWGGITCLPNPAPCGYGACPSYPAYPAPAYPAYGYAAPAPVAPAAPAAVPAVRPQGYTQQYTQQVGYYFYGQNNAPSYWYGY